MPTGRMGASGCGYSPKKSRTGGLLGVQYLCAISHHPNNVSGLVVDEQAWTTRGSLSSFSDCQQRDQRSEPL